MEKKVISHKKKNQMTEKNVKDFDMTFFFECSVN